MKERVKVGIVLGWLVLAATAFSVGVGLLGQSRQSRQTASLAGTDTVELSNTPVLLSSVSSLSPEEDARWVSRLAHDPIVSIIPKKFSSGGEGLGMVLLQSNIKAMFKTKGHQGEVIAYHLDRLLGFNKVPPVVKRVLEFRKDGSIAGCLQQCEWRGIGHADLVERLSFPANVTGVMIAFVQGLRHMKALQWENCQVSEHQESAMWKYGEEEEEEASLGKRFKWWFGWTDRSVVVPFSRRPCHGFRLELSDLALFDYLISNNDRFKPGKLVNLHVTDKGEWVYLDHHLTLRADLPVPRSVLKFCSFRNTTVTNLRRFVDEGVSYVGTALRKRLQSTGNSAMVADDDYQKLDERILNFFRHVDDCITQFGMDNVIMDLEMK